MIECDICLYDKSLEELGIEPKDEDDLVCKMSLNENSIDAVRQSINKDGVVNKDKCIVYLRSGETFLIGLSYDFVRKRVSFS